MVVIHHRSGCSKGVARGLGKWNGAEVHLERPGFTFCRVGEGVGWLGNNRKDGREVQVCFGHGELSGSGRSLGSCSPQGLRVRSRTASQWCGVRTRRGEAQTYWKLLPTASGRRTVSV